MDSKIYTAVYRGERVMRFHLDGDGTIYLEDLMGDLEVAPFDQDAACHDPKMVADMLNEWLEAQGGAAWPAGRHVDIEIDG